MALTTCRECTGEVSTEAGQCPRCGTPAPTGAAFHRRQWRILAVFLTLTAVLVVVGVSVFAAQRNDDQADELREQCDRLEQTLDGIPESLWDRATRDALAGCR